MIKKYTCIICPNGCEIEVELEKNEIKSIKGSACKKGDKYVHQELFNPRRNIATSIKIQNGDLPIVSARLSEPIPKDKIFEVMDLIKDINLQAPVYIGDIVIKNILNLNSNLIITKNIEKIS